MKRILCVLLAVMMLAAMAACGSSAAKEVDTAALVSDLVNNLRWDSAMTEEKEAILKIAMSLPDDASVTGYLSDGTTGEMAIAIRCEDTAAAQEGVQSYLDETEYQMSLYFPEEVERVQNAIVEVSGDVIVVCAAGDTAAAQGIIDGYLK